MKALLWVAFLICVLGSLALAEQDGIHPALIQSGKVEQIRALLAANPKLVHVQDNLLRTPLFTAADWGQVEVGRTLLAYGADVNAVDVFGFTPLIEACTNMGALGSETIKARDSFVAFLLKNGAKVNAACKQNRTALHKAAYNDRAGAARLLIANGARVDVKDQNGMTPLYNAAQNYTSATAEILLANGANPNAKDADGRTPLSRVIRIETAKAMIAKGADPNIRDNDGYTPLDWAMARSSIEMVKYLLTCGYRVNDRAPNGTTSLFVAAKHNFHYGASMLIAKGAEVNIRCPIGGYTPLHVASAIKGGDVVKVLIENGADVNAKGTDGMTPLHAAAYTGQITVTEILIANGAKLNVRNGAGRTPLGAALATRHSEVARILRGYGATE